jgi:hypothetical protein
MSKVWDVLNRDLLFVKNTGAAPSASRLGRQTVHDPETGAVLLECRPGESAPAGPPERGAFAKEAEFDLMAGLPGGGQPVLRIARRRASLPLGRSTVTVYDGPDTPVGTLKEKVLALGVKYQFRPDRAGRPAVLHFEGRYPASGCVVFCDGQKAAEIFRAKTPVFQEGDFEFAFAIAREIPANAPLRQVLLGVALAKYWVIS